MKRILSLWPIWFVILTLAFVFYVLVSGLNPNSVFCDYKIYANPDGTYEVWWNCRTRHCELSGVDYATAKAFQIKECNELKAFIMNSPKGKRVL